MGVGVVGDRVSLGHDAAGLRLANLQLLGSGREGVDDGAAVCGGGGPRRARRCRSRCCRHGDRAGRLLCRAERPLQLGDAGRETSDVALERLLSQRGFDRADAEARIRSQISREERVKEADYVLDNAGDRGTLAARVTDLWDWLLEAAAEQRAHA